MALNETEQLLVEAIKTMLSQDSKLGLSIHDDDPYNTLFNSERGMEYLHNHINDLFALRSAELIHADSVNQAFHKVHSYKYLDDPSFSTAMEKELVAQAVPANERSKALSFIPKIVDEIKEDNKEWAEKDSGFNPEMEEIESISRPEQPSEFEIHDMDGYNEANIESEVGEASPGKTPDSEDL